MLSSEYLPNPAGVSNAVARRQTSPKGEISGRQNPHENARGRKPFRSLIVPDSVYVGDGEIFASGNTISLSENWKGWPETQKSFGFCGFIKSGIATAQIENLRRGARRERCLHPPACQKYFFDRLKLCQGAKFPCLLRLRSAVACVHATIPCPAVFSSLWQIAVFVNG